jgi:beta-lactamase class A
MRIRDAVLASGIALLAACSTQPLLAHPEREEPRGHSEQKDTTKPVMNSADASADSSMPGSRTPIEAVLDEVVSWLNKAPFDARMFEEKFAEDFIEAISFDMLNSIFEELEVGTWTIERVEATSTLRLVAYLTNGADKLQVTLVATRDQPPRIAGLLFQSPFDPPSNKGEALARVQQYGTLSLLVASTSNGSCDPLLTVEPDHIRPLGSVFKLWVLAAISKRVRDGELEWADRVTIRDELDSIPSGVTQDDPDGSTRSVRTLAGRMISISDNTAADHLLRLVGREAVEQAVAESGHAHPERNRPFISTREMVILKFGPDEALRGEYLAADEAGRRALLDDRVTGMSLPNMEETLKMIGDAPRFIDEIEWFGTPLDVCKVMTALASEPIPREILAENSGVRARDGRWSYLGYKGGSETGVLAAAWAHEVSNAKYVTAASLENPTNRLPNNEVLQLLAAVRDFAPQF